MKHPSPPPLRLPLSLALLACVLLLQACAQKDSLSRILDRDELVVVTRNTPATYYLDKHGPTGFEYTLAAGLAEELGVNLRIKTEFNIDAIFSTLHSGQADLAAPGLALTERRSREFLHSQPYSELQPQAVYVAGTFRPREPEDLLDMSVVVLAESHNVQRLEEVRDTQLPGLEWQEIDAADSTALLDKLYDGEAEVAVVDSHQFRLQQSLYPRLRVAFNLGDKQPMAWFLSPARDHARLLRIIDDYLGRLQQNGRMAQLREQFFGHTAGVSRVGSQTFLLKMERDLPEYERLIRQVAREYQLDWHLLAAISYQESHWNPLATSPTGVRGMMMLTLKTARQLDIRNRLDPLQSLRGGARYLKDLKRRLPEDIEEPDRTWFTLAAYNVGMGHLEDARVLTESLGGDPHLWSDVMEHLPLLQKPEYYKYLRYGYARGLEPVTYVQNIRHYYSILRWQDINRNQPGPPIDPGEHLPAPLKALDVSAL